MNDGETVKGVLGMIVIGALALVSLTKGLNGEITKIAIGAIVVLAIGEKAVDYYYAKRTGK